MILLALAAQTVSVPLWRNIEAGMSPDQTATVLRSMEGIKSVTVKSKRGKAEDVEISYVDYGVPLGEQHVLLNPSFSDSQLTEIVLSTAPCESEGKVFADSVATSLAEKYGPAKPVSYTDRGGVEVAQGLAFSNGVTRATLFTNVDTPEPPRRLNASDLGYPMRQLVYNRQMRRCARDNGRSLEVRIVYSSEAASAAAADGTAIQNKAKEKALKDGL